MNPKSVTIKHSRQPASDILENISKYNPTLKNILKVEQALAEHKEFESKAQLTKKLDITMRPPVLNMILKYLEKSNKILLNDDGSIVWIYASLKAKKNWEKAVRLWLCA
jgi:hypothetical protein